MQDDRLAAVIKKYSQHPEYLGTEILDPRQPGGFDNTLLHLTARTGAVEDMEVLISARVRIDARGDLGNTPLHSAAVHGKAESVRLLLKHGANPNLLNEFGETALDIAEADGYVAIVKLLKPITKRADK